MSRRPTEAGRKNTRRREPAPEPLEHIVNRLKRDGVIRSSSTSGAAERKRRRRATSRA